MTKIKELLNSGSWEILNLILDKLNNFFFDNSKFSYLTFLFSSKKCNKY
jgi:hypothetical protein